MYYWKSVGMSSNLFGHKDELESYINYFKSIDTYQGLFTVILIMQNWLTEVIQYREEKNRKDKEKGK